MRPDPEGIAPMARIAPETVVKNLDHRVTQVEQILPTLATKEDVRTTVAEAVAPLATREEMHNAIAEAVAPLATREDMHSAIAEAVAPLATREEAREEGRVTRRHFDVVAERLEGHIRLLAEGQSALRQELGDLRAELKADIAHLDQRLMRVEARMSPSSSPA
jgi:hypothetical protein